MWSTLPPRMPTTTPASVRDLCSLLKVIKRKVGKLLKRKPKLRRQKGKEKLEEVESVQCN